MKVFTTIKDRIYGVIENDQYESDESFDEILSDVTKACVETKNDNNVECSMKVTYEKNTRTMEFKVELMDDGFVEVECYFSITDEF